jgi:hypothetical protein
MISIVAHEGGDEIVADSDIRNLPAIAEDCSPRNTLLSALAAATASRRGSPAPSLRPLPEPTFQPTMLTGLPGPLRRYVAALSAKIANCVLM